MDSSIGVGRGRTYEIEEELVSFLTLLLEVDRRMNLPTVGGSDLLDEGKKET